MVKFNNDNTFTVSIEGENYTYVDTIKSLLAHASYANDLISDNERYCINNLIASMLPHPEQIINSEDVELLKKVKQNKAVVDAITQDDKSKPTFSIKDL